MTMESIKNISLAFLKAQMEMGNAVKGNTNPFYKNQYADLNAVREAVIPVLNANGITVLQPMVHVDGRNFVKTVLLHESGEMIESMTEIIYAKTNDAQAQGSGITYARRYGLQSLVCVGADDDDGNKASQLPKEKQPISSTPKFLDVNTAIDEMESVKSRAEMDLIWRKYVGLQKDIHFLEAVKKMSELYPKQQ